ncbi:MAG TPA: ABC transporter substrate-binding protein [Xanthobacteraceae bacterium]|nr:ABC transporter substrate-binding protein [Xanthobacteraceae bacterium]
MRITRRTGLKGLAAGAATVAMPAIVSGQEQEIVIGAPNSLTGGIGEGGQRNVWGLQIAVDQINKAGGIKALGGAKLKLIVADTTSDNPTQAASVTRRMIDQDKATIICGATASAMTLALQVETEKSELPLITTSYADGIVTRGYKYTFKITPQGGGIWNWSMTNAYELWKTTKGSPPKSALIFQSNDAVGLVVQKMLPEHAKTLNLEVPFSQSFQMGLSDPSVAVAPVLRYKPDLIFLGGFPNDLILIIKALRGVGVTAPIFGAGPSGYDSAGRGLGAAGDRLFAPVIWNWDLTIPGNKELIADYKAAQPNAPFPPANEQIGAGYATGQIIQQALEKAASRDPKKLRDVIASTEFTNLTLPATKVKFGDNGLNTLNTALLGEWMKGELRTVWPKEFQATAPLL